jgi:hypothetical protein
MNDLPASLKEQHQRIRDELRNLSRIISVMENIVAQKDIEGLADTLRLLIASGGQMVENATKVLDKLPDDLEADGNSGPIMFATFYQKLRRGVKGQFIRSTGIHSTKVSDFAAGRRFAGASERETIRRVALEDYGVDVII